jgi:hypothetical protein
VRDCLKAADTLPTSRHDLVFRTLMCGYPNRLAITFAAFSARCGRPARQRASIASLGPE